MITATMMFPDEVPFTVDDTICACASSADEPQLTSENRASALSGENVASAYAALLDDNEAFRTRLEREQSRIIGAERASIAQALLESTDDLERALSAVGTVSVSDPSQHGIVIEEVRSGYRVGDRLLRAAQVRVGNFQGI